jgi:iron complex transport system substrate-binding protein
MVAALNQLTLTSAMPKAELRIISLIPSATEIVAALGLEGALVGRSHECDYPPTVQSLPICTAPNLNPQGTSREIHDRVEDLLQSALSIYRIDLDALERLRPTHILTQAQCEVCAVSLAEVETAVAQLTSCSAQIISLQPAVLEDVWADLKRVAQAVGVEGEAVIAALQDRVAMCQQKAQALPHRPRVACIEWTEPLMTAGNWVPELVALAGGENLFGTVGQHSPWMQWDELVQANPDVLVVMPCGFDLEKTREAAIADLTQHPHWRTLKAVQQGQVYLTDGNQYFNRPGPRLVDSLEILAEIFHPELDYGYEGRGWVRLQTA